MQSEKRGFARARFPRTLVLARSTNQEYRFEYQVELLAEEQLDRSIIKTTIRKTILIIQS